MTSLKLLYNFHFDIYFQRQCHITPKRNSISAALLLLLKKQNISMEYWTEFLNLIFGRFSGLILNAL